MRTVLLVDDMPALAEQYSYDLRRLGFRTVTASGGAEALDAVAREAPDCMVLDLEMPGVDGFEVLRRLRKEGVELPVIVYTGTGNFDRCTQAIQLGAYAFIDKAEPMERVVQEIENALEHGRLVTTVRRLERRLGDSSSLVGSSAAMARLREHMGRVAAIPSPVLILGESGTGKELVARDLHRLHAKHRNEPPDRAPFVPVNCAALPESLVESELFGHERGAFTGAHRLRKGAFESAGRGTLFLDEIGELPLPAQAKLLRVLEERQLVRVGGDRAIPVEARIVAATHRDLEAEIAAGRFRQDLHFRINVHVLAVPPLRDRREDVPELTEHFLTLLGERFGMRRKRITSDALETLQACDWSRNNVRELRNIVERMIIASDGDTLEASDVPPEIRRSGGAAPLAAGGGTFKELRADAERHILLAALERNGGHVTRTAEELGLADHSSLIKIMRRLGIERDG